MVILYAVEYINGLPNLALEDMDRLWQENLLPNGIWIVCPLLMLARSYLALKKNHNQQQPQPQPLNNNNNNRPARKRNTSSSSKIKKTN